MFTHCRLLLYFLFSCWWRLLAAAEPRRVSSHGQRWGLLLLLPHMPGHVRLLPHDLWLPPHQNAQTEAKGPFGEGRETPEGPAAPPATAPPAEAPRLHQGLEPETSCCCCQTGEEGLMMRMKMMKENKAGLGSVQSVFRDDRLHWIHSFIHLSVTDEGLNSWKVFICSATRRFIRGH